MVVVFIVVIAALLAIAGAYMVTMRNQREREAARAPFPLIYPLHPSSPAEDPAPELVLPPERPSRVPEARAFSPTPAYVPEDQPTPVTQSSEGGVAVASDSEPDTSSTVRFRRPADEAVELLPGRLEVLAGEPRHKEIRFVRAPGERPEVVLGRDLGDSPGQVALHSRTVSRRHARLAYQDGEWRVANLSQTNPVVVNDEVLLVGNGERPLADGDCLELGEVVLRFHAR